MHTGVQRVTKISAGNRYPGGRKRPEYQPRHAGANNLARRVHDGFRTMVKLGLDARWASTVGRLHLDGKLSELEVQAAWVYAAIAAGYDHHHTPSRRTAKSQAYEISRGEVDEIELAIRNGSINDLERRARRVKKRWDRAVAALGPQEELAARVCLSDESIPDEAVPRFKRGLFALAVEFKLEIYGADAIVENRKIEKAMPVEKRVRLAVEAVARWFEEAKDTPLGFVIGAENAAEKKRGIKVMGTSRIGAKIERVVLIRCHSRDLVAHVDSLFLKACQARGWTEEKG